MPSEAWMEHVRERQANERSYRRSYILEMRDGGYSEQVIRMALRVRDNKRKAELANDRLIAREYQ